jgi:hypothetical protein
MRRMKKFLGGWVSQGRDPEAERNWAGSRMNASKTEGS